jgi:hypothetical protein
MRLARPVAGTAALLALLLAPLACAKLLPQAETLAACFQLADWTLEAGEALSAGVAKERHMGAAEQEAPGPRETRRAAIEAVYRDRPRYLSDYIAAKLGACLRERGAQIGDLTAKACYDQTLWAGTFFASRRRGVALERLIEGYGGSGAAFGGVALAPLAEAVYRTDKPELEFRRDLFLECVMRPLPAS